ncbi:glycerol-3-phosphate dehydrogenase/oxidase [Pseudohalioglobus lutimaris]|jgi:glycerol-3-phosphate dehydrogenase|uniref:Glycerol-3-phosphate dehydrogenase n=1 Tax=Pseudohalioglobus lutimaris TaxID=1737061 RepID=A0A2N5WX27_9GAMM|nr:glycerol-3-phosphate dehydrogenase/oxidase [Pseudohalioglobus lutimaris]PLW66778.1 glycerol-3-phosphate dehydrogenase [Pseudohalioglobus lutimaris]
MTSTHLDLRDRAATFTALKADTFDMLVIGGGITGAGIAREAALRGLSVCLVEAQDFASGTSSRSSKMVHGGMRYLLQGDLAVVREAARERRTLRKIAPHLATTLPMILMARGKTGVAKFRTGMWTYEKLGQVVAAEKHEALDLAELQKREPLLITEGYSGAVTYPEYLTDDGRLTLANVRSAAAAGAVVASYAAATEILLENGKAIGAIVKGQLVGEERTAAVRARTIVNASGPWVDAIRKLEDENAPSKLLLTKGIHVVFKRERFPVNSSVVMSTSDKRAIFTCPRGDYVYLGTTDTFHPDSEYWPEISSEDIDYLIDVTNTYFDVEPLTHADIVSVWSGVRPLIAEEGKSPSEISRKDDVLEGAGGVISIAGGKLTAYRVMANRVIELCENRLGRKVGKCRSADYILPGGDLGGSFAEFQEQLEQQGLAPNEAERMTRLYGSEALDILGAGGDLEAEVEFAVKREGALTLEDYWVRRSARARFSDAGGIDCLVPAAGVMAKLLDWTEQERDQQVEGCVAIRNKEMAAVRKTA